MPRVLLVLLAILALAAPGPAAAAGAEQVLLYEAVPAVGGDALAAAPFARRADLTDAVAHQVVPDVLRALGLDPHLATTRATFGGWQLHTNPTLATTLAVPDAEADRAAAALGWVLRQGSVLVAEIPDAAEGDTLYVVLRVADRTLDPDMAQSFFELAAAIDSGMGGGYTALDDTLLFLNLRDGTGKPYSGLDDTAFAAALGMAAGTFSYATPKLYDTGRADARLVGNDWSTAADGEDYATRLAPATLAALRPLRDRFDALLRTALPQP